VIGYGSIGCGFLNVLLGLQLDEDVSGASNTGLFTMYGIWLLIYFGIVLVSEGKKRNLSEDDTTKAPLIAEEASNTAAIEEGNGLRVSSAVHANTDKQRGGALQVATQSSDDSDNSVEVTDRRQSTMDVEMASLKTAAAEPSISVVVEDVAASDANASDDGGANSDASGDGTDKASEKSSSGSEAVSD
jgi:hypothetical protein